MYSLPEVNWLPMTVLLANSDTLTKVCKILIIKYIKALYTPSICVHMMCIASAKTVIAGYYSYIFGS